MSKIIGLTGGIASGKSTVSNMFKTIDVPVIDTDLITHNLYQKNTVVHEELIKAFGEEIVFANKDINRKRLGQMIYNDKALRQVLNNIVHPHVKNITLQEIERLKLMKHELIVVDVPLLFETDFRKMVDISVVVYVEPALQLQRLIDRDQISAEFASSKIAAQMSLEEKKELADYVIDNSRSILDTRKQFNSLIEKLGVE